MILIAVSVVITVLLVGLVIVGVMVYAMLTCARTGLPLGWRVVNDRRPLNPERHVIQGPWGGGL